MDVNSSFVTIFIPSLIFIYRTMTDSFEFYSKRFYFIMLDRSTHGTRFSYQKASNKEKLFVLSFGNFPTMAIE